MQERIPDKGDSPLPLLSADTRRAIAARAASLDELAHRLRDRVAAGGSAPGLEGADMAALSAWLNACSPGDADAFTRRLAWDGLDLPAAAWLVSEAAAIDLAADPPDWLDRLEAVVAEAGHAAEELAGGALEQATALSAEGLPYAEILVPMVRVAEAAIEQRLGPGWEALATPAAREAWSRQIARELAGLAQMALHQRFETFRDRVAAADAGPTGDGEGAPDAYFGFVLHLLHEGLPQFFEDFAVLARHLALAIDRHVDNVERLVRRFAADHDAIATLVGSAQPLVPIEGVEPALSDPHDGRQRVVALTCAGGVRVVYKPRDVRLEHAFGQWLASIAAAGCASVPPGLRVVVGEGYGWEAWVAREAFDSVEQVRHYYRKAGGLLCAAWLLGGRDLHLENVVATRSGPVIVDLEALFAPGEARAAGGGPTGADTGVGTSTTAASSCLQTGLLTYVAGGPDTPLQEVGGLRGRGAGTSTLARRVWRHLGTAAIAFAEDTSFAIAEHNAVLLDGTRQPPEAFAEEIVEGFGDVYRHLSAGGAAPAADAALAAFAGAQARVFTRDTNQYGMLLHVLAAPRYQDRGVRRSIAYDVLARGLTQAAARPAEWPIVQIERAALDALDVPRFTTPVDGTSVQAGDLVVLDRPHQQPGVAAAAERWRRLSPADLAQHQAAIRRVLADLRQPRFTAPWPERGTAAAGAETPDQWRACAAWVGRELVERARLVGNTLVWHGDASGALPSLRAAALHDGALGPALLLAALAAERAGEEFEAMARAAILPVRHRWLIAGDDGSMPIGATTGLSSVAYGLGLAGALLRDGSMVDTAVSVAASLTPARIAADPHLDVVAGAAGAALALLALHRVRPEPALLAAAVACGDLVLAREDRAGEGGLWRAPAGYAYTGFAHGLAGMAAACARLAEATGLERFLDAAGRAYRRLAAARAGGAVWPLAFRPEDPTAGADLPVMTAWCHGAPGIAIALLSAPDALRDATWRDGIEAAVRLTGAAATHKTEHVCCGNLSRAEALWTASRRLGLSAAEAAASRTAAGVVRRAAVLGHLRLSAVPFDYRVFDAAFFQGSAGAGYQLLRMAGGGRLPSVLALEGRPFGDQPSAATDLQDGARVI